MSAVRIPVLFRDTTPEGAADQAKGWAHSEGLTLRTVASIKRRDDAARLRGDAGRPRDGRRAARASDAVDGCGVTTYYKATRPDGRDFHTGTIDYAAALASGEAIRHPTSKRMVRDDARTYISVSVEPADCTGFRWPCRLFRVEPEGKVMGGMNASRHKRGVLGLRVPEELPAWQVFGPNGDAVVALIERARTLTAKEAQRMAAGWDAGWDAARDAGWDAARDAARDAGWDAARDVARDAAWDAAWAAARDAARALLVRDRINPEHFETLVAPWVAGVGRTWEGGAA